MHHHQKKKMKMLKVDDDTLQESDEVECLNRDIMFHILSRVPVKPLLGMKCISRGWHSMISNRSFINAQLQNTQLLLNGFILQDRYMFCKHDIKTVSYIPVESTKIVHKSVFSFLPEEVVVLASHKGIVGCRSCLPSSNPTLYLCNPSNRDWIQLQWPLQCAITDSISLAFDFDPSKFKLVLVKRVAKNNEEEEEEEEESFFYTFEMYSSETKTWRKSDEICNCNGDLIKNKGVYIGGVLHWLTERDQILTFDVEKELSWLISVPVPAFEFTTVPEACIGEYEGRLHYVQVSEEGLHVWCLEDYYESNWILKHCKSLEDFEVEYPRVCLNLKNRVSERVDEDTNPWMNPLGFKDGKLLIKVSVEMYIYDMEDNKMAHVCSFLQLNPQSMYHPTVFPYSLTLVPLDA